jgi:hypothetical protein
VPSAASAALGVLLAASFVACGPPPPAQGGAGAPRRALAGSILREDRVVVTRGTVIRALGVSRRWVYGVTGEAVLVLDRDRNAWLPPFTREAGFDPSLVRRMAVDPDDESAWLITQTGAWTLSPLTGFIGRAPAGPAPPRLRASSLEQVYREFPSVQAFSALLTRDDASFAAYPVIAGARAPDRTEVWLGTEGGGLFQVDPLFNRATPRPYGLAASGAGALARAADGVWIAPASRALEPRLAVTFATQDLQQFRWLDDAMRRGFGGARGTALDARGGTLWMGTTRGLFRIETAGAGARAFTPMVGLPGDVVLSVLARGDGVWVGTEGGLAVLPADSAVGRGGRALLVASPRAPVRGLLATGDTLWMASDAGVLLLPPRGERAVLPAAAAAQPRLRQPARALATADSLVFVALADAVLTFSRRDGEWAEPWPAVPWRAVGEIVTIAADAKTIWAGGPFGVLAVDRATGGSRILRVGSDLPDAVTSVLLDGPYAWIGTLGGVVRVRRASDGQLP